ncbi:hypothetical protein CGZ80_22330 [Rhodopirellula sp. MGV]|nr:hypothetical protein CGZ80_22330 [Rhodopirellula sp. MGV]PNY33545.1 hypothetical protein C2E31_28085 [Rhodopirellula baltica]
MRRGTGWSHAGSPSLCWRGTRAVIGPQFSVAAACSLGVGDFAVCGEWVVAWVRVCATRCTIVTRLLVAMTCTVICLETVITTVVKKITSGINSVIVLFCLKQ